MLCTRTGSARTLFGHARIFSQNMRAFDGALINARAPSAAGNRSALVVVCPVCVLVLM